MTKAVKSLTHRKYIQVVDVLLLYVPSVVTLKAGPVNLVAGVSGRTEQQVLADSVKSGRFFWLLPSEIQTPTDLLR